MKAKILMAIAEAYPYPLKDVQNIFDRTKSYDETLKVLDIAIAAHLDIYDIVRIVEVKI